MTDAKGAAAPVSQDEKDASDYAWFCLHELKILLAAGELRKAQGQTLSISVAIARLAKVRESGDG